MLVGCAPYLCQAAASDDVTATKGKSAVADRNGNEIGRAHV